MAVPSQNRLVVEDDAKEGSVDPEVSVVVDESKVSELVHEKVDARTRRPDHLGKRFLRDFWYPQLRALPLPVPRQQQQRPR